MSDLNALKSEVNKLTGGYKAESELTPPSATTVDTQPPSMFSNMLQPPIIYMIGIFIFICIVLLYQKPCFVCKEDEQDKEKEKNVDMKWFLISVILLAALTIGIVYPYIK